MKTRKIIPLIASGLQLIVLALVLFILPKAKADPIIWDGPTTNFVQAFFGQADVLVPGAVSLTRNNNHWLYNTNVESFANFGTPSDTEWAFGSLANYASLFYQSFDSYKDGNFNLVLTNGGPMVCHLINEDIYLSVKFTQWPHGGGLIKYTRSTPHAVTPPPPTPSVTITNPTSGAVFSAPANVSIAANATVSSGMVTNVQFFRTATLIGSDPSAPFSTTANGLGAGSYALTAVATAAGISATSAPVNISVVTPVTTSLSIPVSTPDNQFAFSYSTTPGLRYEIDISSNLFNWTPLTTNVATGDPSFFTNPISGDGNYYRVGRLPNP